MNLVSMMRKSLILAAGALCLAFAVATVAQVQTQTTTTSGPATKAVTIESGEVVAVEGNDLFVKMPDGTLRDFPNIPASAKVNVDGKQLGVHELQPGMKLQRTTVTTTTPYVVTTIQTVTGKVWHVTPPLKVILTLENNENQAFMIPDGQKFTVDGQEVDAWGLKKGMMVTATKIVQTPVTAVTEHTQVTGTIPASGTVLIAKGAPTPAAGGAGSTAAGTTTAETTTASAKLPKTATGWPLLGVLGLLLIASSFGLALRRRSFGLRG
jgi:LPXTG-motif cell wall-anchored protein